MGRGTRVQVQWDKIQTGVILYALPKLSKSCTHEGMKLLEACMQNCSSLATCKQDENEKPEIEVCLAVPSKLFSKDSYLGKTK